MKTEQPISRVDNWLFVILLLAAALRMIQPGLYSTWIDELIMTDAAMRLAQNGDWTWIGNPTSFQPIPVHSPFSIYLTALPLSLTGSWMIARLFVAVLNTLAIAVLYAMLKQYAGRSAALSGAALLAVMPLAVDWSRFVWNPNYAPLFIVSWMYSGLSGYYDGNRKGQILHWVFLSAIIQAQTSLIIFVPLSVLLVVYRLWDAPKLRLELVQSTLMAWGITALTLIPWVIGIIGVKQGTIVPLVQIAAFRDGGGGLHMPDFALLIQQFSLLTSSATFHLATLSLSDNPAGWWPDTRLNILFRVQTITLLMVMIVAIERGLRNKKEFPGLWFSLVALWSFTYSFVSSGGISHHYLMVTLYAGVALFGMFWGWLWHKQRLMLIVMMIFLGGQLWLTLAVLNWYQRDSNAVQLQDVTQMLSRWANSYGDIVLLEEATNEANLTQTEWSLYWNILREEYPIRSIQEQHAIPIHEDGTLLVGVAPSPALSSWSEKREEEVSLANRSFSSAFIHPEDIPPIQFFPQIPATFDDLIRLRGVSSTSTPNPGEAWDLIVIWEPLRENDTQMQFSVRLMDSDGTGYGQVDGGTLQPHLWRVGDVVMTRFTLNVADTLPENSGAHLEILTYSWPDVANMPLVGEDGNMQGTILKLYRR